MPGANAVERNLFDDIQVGDGFDALSSGDEFLHRGLLPWLIGAQDAAQRASGTQTTGEGACIDALQAGNASPRQIRAERFAATPVVILLAAFAHDQRGKPGAARFHILWIDAIVADQWIGEHNHLAAIRGIGANLLIASHASGKDDLAFALARQDGVQRPKRAPLIR